MNTKFYEKVIDEANLLLCKYELKDWSFNFNNKNNLGTCDYKKKTIYLSYKSIHDMNAKEITDTLLHEIAHALSPLGSKHGKVWKQICRNVGAIPKASHRLEKYEPNKNDGYGRGLYSGVKVQLHPLLWNNSNVVETGTIIRTLRKKAIVKKNGCVGRYKITMDFLKAIK